MSQLMVVVEDATMKMELEVSHLDSWGMCNPVEEDKLMMAEAAKLFYQQFYEDLRTLSCIMA